MTFYNACFCLSLSPNFTGSSGKMENFEGGGVPSQHRGRVSIWQLGLCLFSGKTSVLVLVNHECVESQHLLEHSRDLWGTTWGASKRGLFSTSPLCELRKLVTRKLLLAIPLSCLRKVSLVSLPYTSKGKQNVTVSCLVRADGVPCERSPQRPECIGQTQRPAWGCWNTGGWARKAYIRLRAVNLLSHDAREASSHGSLQDLGNRTTRGSGPCLHWKHHRWPENFEMSPGETDLSGFALE